MPRIEIGDELVEIADCPVCDRTVLKERRAVTGFVAPCGRRLINLAECGKAVDVCKEDGDDVCNLEGPPPDLRIRRMVDGDAEAVHAIHCACLTRTLARHYSPEQIAAWAQGRTPDGYLRAAASGERFFVAEAEGRVVGFASWEDDELLALFVHPDAQGTGVGSRLLDACIDDAKAEGAEIACVKAALGAEGFYARRGFVPVKDGFTVKNGVAIPDVRMVRSVR